MEHRQIHGHGRGRGGRRGRMMESMGRRHGSGHRMGAPFGGVGRGETMRAFFAENAECAEKMVRFGVARMKADGFTNDEIRSHLTDMEWNRFLSDTDIDTLLT